MCLEVHAGGVVSGAGSHISLALLLMKGEFDDKLEWPIVSHETLSVTLEKHQMKSFWDRITKYYYLRNFSKCVEVSGHAVETCEKFADNHTVMSDCVRNDSLTFTVSLNDMGERVLF